MEAFELSIDGNAPELRNSEVNSTLEFRGQRPGAAMRAGSFRLLPKCSACRTLMVVFKLSIDGNAPGRETAR